MNISNTETEYEGSRAYDIKTNGKVIVFFPVKYEETELYRIVNDVSVKMSTTCIDSGEQKYLIAELTSNSLYYLTESSEPFEPSDSGSDSIYRALLVLIVAVVFAAPILAKKRAS